MDGQSVLWKYETHLGCLLLLSNCYGQAVESNLWVQVAVVGFVKGRLTVKATSADQHLGGRDFDDLLYEHFRKEFLEKSKVRALSDLITVF